MPLTPQGSRTFLHALSDFWPLYFQDQDLLSAYAEGITLNAAQAYQTLLETVLGQSLKDVPLFAKTFYRPYFLRENAIRFEEGPSPAEDKFLFATGDALTGGRFLANRVLAPTDALLEGREFTIRPGTIAFHSDPFAGLLVNFPSRIATVETPAAWTDPLGRVWEGVRPGDRARWTVGGVTREAVIEGTFGATLYLDSAPAGITLPLARRGGTLVVTRTPFDATVSHLRLVDHPTSAERLSSGASDGTTITSTREIDVTGLANYRGAWATATDYAEGDLVSHSGKVWRALVEHTSPGSFSATPWDDLSTGYFYITCSSVPRYTQLIAAETPSTSGRLKIAVGAFSTATSVKIHRVTYALASADRPTIALPHRHQAPGSVSITARRLVDHVVVDRDGDPSTFPAGENVIEGVDFTLDPDTGTLTVLSLWDPGLYARAAYTWSLEVARRSFSWRGAYASATAYQEGDLVVQSSVVYVISRTHTSDGTLASDTYLRLVEPVTTAISRTVREYSFWLLDALIDEQRLARNFGELLLRPSASSEAQRAFLLAASRLFLLGPTFSLITSAVNALLGLPLVREANEKLLSYSNGIELSGSDAQVFGTMSGTEGALTASPSRFTSTRGRFLASDVGASIRVLIDEAFVTYTVIAVISATEVEVSPAPFADAEDLVWEADHVTFTSRIRVDPSDYRFTPADVGAWIRITGGMERNQGVFRIISVDDPLTAELDTPYSLLDESEISWALSRTGVQTVTTHRREYSLPLGVPVRAPLLESTNWGVLLLPALSPISDAVSVDDYITDPTWWHHIQIPEELFEGTPAQRTVTPALIEHVYGALDDAHFGDLGLNLGADEFGRMSAARPFTGTWYGGGELALTVTAPGPALHSRDVGSYAYLDTPPFAGAFRISRVHAGGGLVTLENFPPAEASHEVPPKAVSGHLPEIVFRHTVAFILMDHLLKYHCVRVRLDPSVSLTSGVLTDISTTLRAAKPSHVFIFVEAGTTFTDTIELEEDLELDLGLSRDELILPVDNQAYMSPDTLLRYGDAFRFEELSVSVTLAAEVPVSLPVVLPAGTAVEATLVKVGLDPAARVSGRMPAEGVDYTVDYVTGEITLHAGLTLTPDPVQVDYTVCIRRIVAEGDPLDPGEGYLVYGGSDPTTIRAPGQAPTTAGLIDRTVQLTFGP